MYRGQRLREGHGDASNCNDRFEAQASAVGHQQWDTNSGTSTVGDGPNRLLLLFMTVFALPKASSSGFTWWPGSNVRTVCVCVCVGIYVSLGNGDLLTGGKNLRGRQ